MSTNHFCLFWGMDMVVLLRSLSSSNSTHTSGKLELGSLADSIIPITPAFISMDFVLPPFREKFELVTV